jgi:hypothetical protein
MEKRIASLPRTGPLASGVCINSARELLFGEAMLSRNCALGLGRSQQRNGAKNRARVLKSGADRQQPNKLIALT